MKTVIALALALGATTAALAQAPAGAPAPAAVDAVRQAASGDRRGLVEKYMQLSPEEGKKFWPIYDAYQADLGKIVARQNRAALDYVNTESSMSNANALRLAKELLAADGDEQALRQKTFRKVAAAIPAKKAVRFVQIENKVRTLQRYDLAGQMPLVR
jgi:Spy/CpxP family protein refolding chaperone